MIWISYCLIDNQPKMKYCLIKFEDFKEAIGIEKIELIRDDSTGFHHVEDEFGNKYQCQENIDFTKPMAFYLQKGLSIDEAKLINHKIIFTNCYDIFEGDVLHINLRISPSSSIGSKEVNDMVDLYKHHDNSNISLNNLKKLIKEKQFNIEKQTLNSIINWGRYKGISIRKAIIEDKSFDLIHWATTNIKWFYFNYDSKLQEGLSIRRIIEKYGNEKTKADFKEVLKVYDVKSSIFSTWNYNESDSWSIKEFQDYDNHENWIKEIRNDWMDNADDYWNID